VYGIKEPKELLQIQALDDNLDLVSQWAFNATNDTYSYRQTALSQAQGIKQTQLRIDATFTIQATFEKRLLEIEKTEEIYRVAYDTLVSLIDKTAIFAYAVKVAPYAKIELQKSTQQRLQANIEKSKAKSREILRKKEEKQKQQLKKALLRKG